MGDTIGYLVIEMIECGRCGYFDKSGNFPVIESEEGVRILGRFGWNLSNAEHKGSVWTAYAGAICPSCGCFSDLDFDSERRFH